MSRSTASSGRKSWQIQIVSARHQIEHAVSLAALSVGVPPVSGFAVITVDMSLVTTKRLTNAFYIQSPKLHTKIGADCHQKQMTTRACITSDASCSSRMRNTTSLHVHLA